MPTVLTIGLYRGGTHHRFRRKVAVVNIQSTTIAAGFPADGAGGAEESIL